MDRRAIFFLLAGIASLCMVPFTPHAYVRVGEWLAVTYGVLGVLSQCDHWGRHGFSNKR